MTLFADSGNCWPAAGTPFDVATMTTAAMNVTVNECGNLFMVSFGYSKSKLRSLRSNTKEEVFFFHQLAPECPRSRGTANRGYLNSKLISMKKGRILDSSGMVRSRRRHRCGPVRSFMKSPFRCVTDLKDYPEDSY